MDAMLNANIKSLKLLHSGKVRDMYEIDDKHILIVTTDRLSAFDVILPTPIPGKGKVLNAVSDFWFHKLSHIVPSHISNMSIKEAIPDITEQQRVASHAIVVKRLKPLPIEAIVRGYLIGSGWKEYQKQGSVCDIKLPEGLILADELPEPIFTPSTKAAVGEHDENIDFQRCAGIIGGALGGAVEVL
ncbi:MAG: phosphoribosylaminoimidazolesuccinocarboxamide synthase, partial [Mariprofundaceae bacterium]